MQKIRIVAAIAIPLMAAAAAPMVRATDRTPTTRQVRVMNVHVDRDGMTLKAGGQTWTVTDPWLLAGHEDQEVKAEISENKQTKSVKVLKVLSGEPNYWAGYNYWDDSAFDK
jgi:hypothetical protein